MRKTGIVFIVSAIVLSAPWAWAQRPQGRGRFGGGFARSVGLLGQKSVQTELDLSAEQVGKVDAYLAKQREAFSGFRELGREERRKRFQESAAAARGAVNSILNGNQLKRFKQIDLQLRGAQAFDEAEVASELDLTDDQKNKIGEIQTTARQQARTLFQGGGDRGALREKFQAARAATREKLQGLLTPEQKAKWKALIGEPFKGDLQFGPGNRGPGNPGPGNRQPGNDEARTRPLPAGRPANGSFERLTSFRQDSDDADNDDQGGAKKSDAKPRKKSHAKKPSAGKPRGPKGKPASAEAGRRGGPGRPGFGGPPHFARRDYSDRDRAWDHVARAMSDRRAHRRGRSPLASRGHSRSFSHAPRHGHFGRMAGGRYARPMFAARSQHRRPPWAHFQGRTGHDRHFGFAGYHGRGQGMRYARHGMHRPWGPFHGHHPFHGRRMARYPRGADHGDFSMAWHPFPGHHGPAIRHGHDGHGPHRMASWHHDHSRRDRAAGHRRHGPVRHASFKKHHEHGHHEHGHHGRGHHGAGKGDHHRHGDAKHGHHKRNDDRDDEGDKVDD